MNSHIGLVRVSPVQTHEAQGAMKLKGIQGTLCFLNGDSMSWVDCLFWYRLVVGCGLWALQEILHIRGRC